MVSFYNFKVELLFDFIYDFDSIPGSSCILFIFLDFNITYFNILNYVEILDLFMYCYELLLYNCLCIWVMDANFR